VPWGGGLVPIMLATFYLRTTVDRATHPCCVADRPWAEETILWTRNSISPNSHNTCWQCSDCIKKMKRKRLVGSRSSALKYFSTEAHVRSRPGVTVS